MVQFLFLITRSFGGCSDTFGTVKKSSGGASKYQRNILEKIYAIHKRLDKVMVENRDLESAFSIATRHKLQDAVIKERQLLILTMNVYEMF